VTILAVCLPRVLSVVPSLQGVHAESTNEMLRVPTFVKRIDAPPCDRLPAPRTKGPRLLMVVHIAVGLPCVLVESPVESFLAKLAYKVLWVPLLSKRIGNLALDWLVAPCAARVERSRETCITIGSRVLLKVCSIREGVKTVGANEMIDVPFLSKRSYAPISNRLLTVCASCAQQLLVTPLAVWLAILLKEAACAKRASTISTYKVLWVVSAPQCGDTLS